MQSKQVANRSTGRLSVSRGRREATRFWLFVGPAVLGLVVFVYIPIVWGMILSFFRARNSVSPTEFVGLENYRELFEDGRFVDSLSTVLIFAVIIVPLTFALSLGLALIVEGAGKSSGLFRTIFFIPTACSYVVASLIWKTSIFNGLPSGLANNVLWQVGEIEPVSWITTTEPPFYWLVLVSVRLWLQSGFYMIIFLAGLKQIPRTQYEAASVDGAKPGWQTFRHITFPNLRNTSIAVVMLLFIEAFQAFDEFRNILASGGSSGTAVLARPPLVYLYDIAFSEQNYGRGSAGAFVLTALILIVTAAQAKVSGFGKQER